MYALVESRRTVPEDSQEVRTELEGLDVVRGVLPETQRTGVCP